MSRPDTVHWNLIVRSGSRQECLDSAGEVARIAGLLKLTHVQDRSVDKIAVNSKTSFQCGIK
jgi:hypothetical protein